MMKRLRYILAAGALLLTLGAVSALSTASAPVYAAASDNIIDAPCPGGGDFFGFPKWYKYLPSQTYHDDVTGKQTCTPALRGINGIWKIVAAIIEILTRLASLLAIGFIVYGGVTYILSQGNPDKTKQALKTVLSAVVGLVITIMATALVSFLAGRFV